MPDRRGVAALAVAVTVGLTGCAGIPTGGSVHVGRELRPAGGLRDVDVRVLPPAPLSGMSPSDIVHGFLHAMVNRDGDYQIARGYLTATAAEHWDTSAGLVSYDSGGVRVVPVDATNGSRTFRLEAPRVSVVDARGNVTPRGGEIHATMRLSRQNGQWRIDRLPDGVLLSTLDMQRAFRLANVYYVSRTSATLVPEQVLLRPEPRGVATALVRTLLTGPGAWLAPSVRTEFPAGTELVGNVPVGTTGIAEVNVSGSVRQATPAQLRLLSAQLVWTLKQVSEVTAVRLLADGTPVPVPGVPLRQPRTAWANLDPAAAPDVPGAIFADATGWRGAQAVIRGLDPARRLSHVALSHDGTRYAGLRSLGHTVTLQVGRVGELSVRVLHARRLTPPTFDRQGAAYVGVTRHGRRWIARVDSAGRVRRVSAPRLSSRPLQRLRLSRDGARVAAVVGRVGAGRLWVGRIVMPRSGVRFEGFRDVLRDFGDVRGVAWDDADRLLVTAGRGTGARELVTVDVDGYDPHTVSVPRRVKPVDVAAAPGWPRIVGTGRSVWLVDDTGWRRLGPGRQPTYAD